MALELRETTQLVSILQMDTKPLQAILEALKGIVRPESGGGGRLCLALSCMMQDNYYRSQDVTCTSELLITAFILHSLSIVPRGGRQPPNTKSSLFYLLQHIEHDIREKEREGDEEGFREYLCLKVFVLQCLAEKPEVLDRTPNQILEEDLKTTLARHNQLQRDESVLTNLKSAQTAFEQEGDLATGFSTRGVTPILVSQSTVDSGPQKDWAYSPGKALDIRFEPICDRPSPPPLGVGEQELSWLYTEGYSTDLIWDTTMSTTHDESLELRDSVQKALRQTLANEEQQSLKQKLSQNPDALLRVGVTPTRLPSLVERNAPVAAHFVATLVSNNPRAAEEFLVSLVNMNTCLGVCNAMGELVKLKEFPVKYAQDFILNAISFIKASVKNSSDPRRVGIVCAFCLLLARDTDPTSTKSKVLQSRELVSQLTQFAVEHATVAEATNLFKTLKEREKEETGGAAQ
eukprot:TRINITY_DN50392_c0_g1_i1.p1 TRINITY_DN50392_c0_g1~~TRINITY_DN50392_c0_g1_i1.p1  ORF type:complete len:461 (+),score=155.03 TRINITY_DN50392_c0_g1_i1:387-1769(+)